MKPINKIIIGGVLVYMMPSVVIYSIIGYGLYNILDEKKEYLQNLGDIKKGISYII